LISRFNTSKAKRTGWLIGYLGSDSSEKESEPAEYLESAAQTEQLEVAVQAEEQLDVGSVQIDAISSR